jgi:hypothetical protein
MMMSCAHLFPAFISHQNKERAVAVGHTIINERADAVIDLLFHT